MSRVLEVPLLEADSFLTIDVSTDLPDDPYEICGLLSDEQCAPKWWLAIASAYSERKALDQAVFILETGLKQSPVLKTDEDRAPFLAMLSWVHLQKMRETATSFKNNYFEKSSECINKSLEAYKYSLGENASNFSVPARLAQGALAAAVGNFNEALKPYQSILDSQPNNFIVKLGRARVLYARGNYRGALKLYQDCLRQTAKLDYKLSMDARIGIGLCFWKLQDRVKAHIAWQRVLSLPGSHEKARAKVHAMLGVWYLDASLYGNRNQFESNYIKSISHFQLAYKSGELPLPALKLASYLFSKHEMDKVNKLTDKVIELANIPELVGEALFWKARTLHYANNLDEAHTLYTQSMQTDAGNVAAMIGKGIVEVSQQRESDALLTFEMAVQSFPKDLDALFYAGIFGALYKKGDQNKLKSREMLDAYFTQCKLSGCTPRVEALVLSSELWESADCSKAYEYLKQAVNFMSPVPVKCLINLAVLAYNLEYYNEAEQTLLKAESIGDETYSKVIAYNFARVKDAQGQWEIASESYEKLNTVDSRARLLLVKGMSNLSEDIRFQINALLDNNPHNMELRALYAWYLRQLVTNAPRELARSAAALEQEFHRQTLSNFDKHNTYSLVSMGNIYLNNSHLQPKSEIAKRQKSYMRAAELFEKALQQDKNNAYAAQGIAIALAETKKTDIAIPIFSRVRETLGDDINAYINSAHCLMEVGDYTGATELYGYAHSQLKNKNDADSNLALLLGRAWLARGSRTKDLEAMRNALIYTGEASQLKPGSKAFEFNLSYVQLQYADIIRRKTPEERTCSQLEQAKEGVFSAIKVLKDLIDSPDASIPFALDDLEEKLDHAESVLLPQLTQAHDDQENFERKASARREEARRKIEEDRKLQRETEEKLEAERKQREAMLAEERLRLQAQAAEWEAERQIERENQQQIEQKSKQRKKQKNDLIDDNEVTQLPYTDSENEADPKASDDEQENIGRKQVVIDDDESDDDAENADDADHADNAESPKKDTKTVDEEKEENLDDLF